jgi:hypothetical protein
MDIKMSKLIEILETVYRFKCKHGTVWFRGHNDSSYKLNSGLYRISNDIEKIRIAENNIFNCFINYGDSYCNKFNENKEWNSLFLMQHYGMYTRLLDWTDSFITALYFAIKDKKIENEACIWMINPIKINHSCNNLYMSGKENKFDNIGLLTLDTLPYRIKDYKSYFEEHIEIGTFSIVPRRSNERLISQNGFFTVQGTKEISLENEYSDGIGDFIDKIIIENSMIDECKEFLSINGINNYSLYGGIDGLCSYIKNELLNLKLENI